MAQNTSVSPKCRCGAPATLLASVAVGAGGRLTARGCESHMRALVGSLAPGVNVALMAVA